MKVAALLCFFYLMTIVTAETLSEEENDFLNKNILSGQDSGRSKSSSRNLRAYLRRGKEVYAINCYHYCLTNGNSRRQYIGQCIFFRYSFLCVFCRRSFRCGRRLGPL